jgi:hypothetical protein
LNIFVSFSEQGDGALLEWMHTANNILFAFCQRFNQCAQRTLTTAIYLLYCCHFTDIDKRPDISRDSEKVTKIAI